MEEIKQFELSKIEIKQFELSEIEKKELELSIDEIIELEDKGIDFMQLMTDLSNSKYPKIKTMLTVVMMRDKEVKKFNDVMTKFVKILIATLKKN